MQSPHDQALAVGKEMIQIEKSLFGGNRRKHAILAKRFERLLKTLSQEEFQDVEKNLLAWMEAS